MIRHGAALLIAAALATAVAGQSPPARATRPIDAGSIITADDLDAPGSPADSPIGREAIRRIPAGRTITAYDMRRVLAVRRGSAVAVSYRAGALKIATQGRALGDAALGQPVRVAVGSRTLDGQATADDTITIRGSL
jgi:flagellar basal body P-ring formation protein FlgA